MNITDLLFALGALVVGGLIGTFLIGARRFNEQALDEKSKDLLEHAQAERTRLVAEARERTLNMKKQSQIEHEEFNKQIANMDKMLEVKGGSFNKRQQRVDEIQKIFRPRKTVTQCACNLKKLIAKQNETHDHDRTFR